MKHNEAQCFLWYNFSGHYQQIVVKGDIMRLSHKWEVDEMSEYYGNSLSQGTENLRSLHFVKRIW